ncbi:hypothetical protein [Amycolatopsis pigmentata]|uniref:Uncharacterized protein n=1 Tax=Amycolatopsis pigmentata TaxID=450801 RepID=A0ABW5FVS7_9PSEU
MTVAIWVALCVADIIAGHWIIGTAGLLLLAGSAPSGLRLRARRRRSRASARTAASARPRTGARSA